MEGWPLPSGRLAPHDGNGREALECEGEEDQQSDRTAQIELLLQSLLQGQRTLARILDATGLPHENDTRARDSEGGFGFGTFLFVNDESGDTIAYGWFGTRSRGFMPTTVEYGRVTR